MSPADIAAVVGTFLAAVISGLGLRRGEAEKRGLPAPEPGLSCDRQDPVAVAGIVRDQTGLSDRSREKTRPEEV